MMRRTAADVAAGLRLVAYERGTSGSAAERAAAAVRVYERLAERLAPLLGVAGMQALFARSMKLIASEVPCFVRVVPGADPRGHEALPAERMLECLGALEPTATTEAAVALFGTLSGLLSALIGERLVWQVLRGAFPGIDESPPKEKE